LTGTVAAVESRSLPLQAALDREWYHTIELAPGHLTPGWFDTRAVVDKLPFPASLEGKRCLDVATFDGFWAFEMERRGAAETIGIDVLDPLRWDWPANSDRLVVETIAQRQDAGRGFEIAREALGSSVERVEMSVYDLDPAEIGTFDFVYVGSLLIHLRDPVRALERVWSVCDGTLLVVDNVDLALSLRSRRRPVAALEGIGRPWWWKLNRAALARVVESAGFEVLRRPDWVWMPPGAGHPPPRLSRALLHSEEARQRLLTSLKGDPHAAVLAAPAS
jgi:tRNA (mo5U34)-methyltransferase